MEKQKAKREIPDNAPDWLEPLLLKESFTYDVDVPLEVVSNALHALEIPSTSLFQQRARSVLVEHQDEARLGFTVTAKRRARSIYNASAVARGALVAEGETTVVRGYSRLSMMGIAGLLVPLILVFVIVLWLVGAVTLMRLAYTITLPMSLMIFVVVGFGWWRFTLIRNDREEMMHDLAEVISRDVPRKGKPQPEA